MTALCQLAKDWTGQLPHGGAMAEIKYDGFRCLWFRGIDGKPRLWTRNGIPIEGCDHIAHRLSLFEQAAGIPLFIDGELVVDGSLAATKKWVETDCRMGGEKGVFHTFDVLPFVEWQRGGGDTPLYERKAMLKRLIDNVQEPWEWRAGSRGRDEGFTPVVLVEDQWVCDAADAVALARSVWSQGSEGLVLKDAESPYVRGRGPAWLKVKQHNISKWRKAA